MFRQERGAIMARTADRMNNRKKFGVIITQGGPGSENCTAWRRHSLTMPSCICREAHYQPALGASKLFPARA
jgi:hypothetical protein